MTMTITDLLSSTWDENADMTRLGPLIREHGVDLCNTRLPLSLDRGTPIYVTTGADPIEVQRRMAEAHAKMLFVLDADNAVVGIIDMWDLITRAEALPWLDPSQAVTS